MPGQLLYGNGAIAAIYRHVRLVQICTGKPFPGHPVLIYLNTEITDAREYRMLEIGDVEFFFQSDAAPTYKLHRKILPLRTVKDIQIH